MKILQIHKYFSTQRGGGSVTAFFETKKLLEKKGHEVQIFSMHDSANEQSSYSKYFIDSFDINDAKNLSQKVRLIPKIIRNREAESKIEQLVVAEKPDIAHIHNIYHYITPAILPVLKKHGVPIVFKLSDYKVICPNYKLFTESAPCTRCKGGKFYNAVTHKCLKNSYAASSIAMLEAYYHRKHNTYDNVDYFLAPSEFMKKTCISFGIPEEKFKILRNTFDFTRFEPKREKQNFIFYIGRLSEEKGIKNLIDAIEMLKTQNRLNDHILKITGTGPQEQALKDQVEKLNLNEEVIFTGFCQKFSTEWTDLMQNARVSVLPSIWYDNSPNTISESMAFGTPAIVSDRGGSKEQLTDGKNGLVYAADNIGELAEKIAELINDPDKAERFGQNAIKHVRQLNSEEKYYAELMKIYTSLTKR